MVTLSVTSVIFWYASSISLTSLKSVTPSPFKSTSRSSTGPSPLASPILSQSTCTSPPNISTTLSGLSTLFFISVRRSTSSWSTIPSLLISATASTKASLICIFLSLSAVSQSTLNSTKWTPASTWILKLSLWKYALSGSISISPFDTPSTKTLNLYGPAKSAP